jgi:hypothetical protein
MDPLQRRKLILRIVLGVLIVLLMGWCWTAVARGVRVARTLYRLGENANRLEAVDTLPPSRSRVELDGTTVATIRSTAHLRAADAQEHYDSSASTRWESFLSPLLRDSTRLRDRTGGGFKGQQVDQVEGIEGAVDVLTGRAAANLYAAEFVAGADTARLAHDASLYATADSTAPIVLRLHRTERPSGPPRGTLLMAYPSTAVPVY